MFQFFFVLLSGQCLANGSKIASSALLKNCSAPNLVSEDAQPVQLNGLPTNKLESQNIRWIGRCVLPFLAGTPDARAETAALSTWWSLREGNLEQDLRSAVGYSNCNINGTDHVITSRPVSICPSKIWQVGIGSAQVANFPEVEMQAREIFRNIDSRLQPADILKSTSSLAGLDNTTAGARISTLSEQQILRRSWLLRNPIVGISLQAPVVRKECVQQKLKWCLQGSYPEARRFSSSAEKMNMTINDLKTFYLGLEKEDSDAVLPDQYLKRTQKSSR